MKKDGPPHNESAEILESFGYFIDAFYRVFKIGIYYPVGHVILDQSAGKCLQQLREISPTLTSVKIAVSKDKIFIQEEEITVKHVASIELQKLLYKIGLKSIEIFRNISHKELLTLVKNLLSWRSTVEATQETLSFDLGELPQSVKVVPQEFMVDAAAQASSDTQQEEYTHLVQLCDALEQQGLTKVQVDGCRSLLENISKQASDQKKEISGFPNATWSDVQGLLFKIVTSSYDSTKKRYSATVQKDINVIASIFENLENDLVDKKSKEVLQLLVSHLTARQEEDESEAEEKKDSRKRKKPALKKRTSEGIDNISVAVLESYIYQNAVPMQILKQISETDNSERFSILLQMLRDEPQGAVWQKVEAEFVKLLVATLSTRETEVIVAGVKSIADSTDTASFSRILTTILETLRGAEDFNSLDFVVNLWGEMSHTMHLILWPFVINELLLVGMSNKKQSFYDATEIASQMHKEGMYYLRPQIEEMEAFQKKEVAETVFRPSFVYSYPLFAYLLQTSLKDILIDKILQAFIEQPEDPYIEAIAPILDMSIPAHVQLLRTYMEQAHLKSMSISLKLEAGTIILEYLQKISDGERDQPWVAKAIAATVGLCVEGTKQILQKIVQEKKLGVLYKWPKDCRKEAANALKGMGSNMLSGKL